MNAEFKNKYFSGRSSVLDVLSLILQKIRRKESLSLIRLGDGEGRLLGYPEFVNKEGEAGEGLDHSLKIWFGHGNFPEDSLIDLSQQLRTAVSDADIVGIPREKQYHMCTSYRHVFAAIDRFQLTNSHQIYTDAALHRYFQFGLFYYQLLNGLDFLGLITGRKNLASGIQSVFAIQKVESHLVPEEALYSKESVAEHFPDRFDALKNEIKVPFRGAVYLVGAGALGKIYCHWIKEAGGIAVDIGSICDSWSGEGRKMHEYNDIDHYKKLPSMSFAHQAKRFNQIIDEFEIDTMRLTDERVEQFLINNEKCK